MSDFTFRLKCANDHPTNRVLVTIEAKDERDARTRLVTKLENVRRVHNIELPVNQHLWEVVVLPMSDVY